MKLYAARHGETDANSKGILQGSSIDGPLNENGAKQIGELAHEIPQDIDVIFCSPAKRVVQSAEILNKKLEVEIIKREELREREYGSLAGKTWDEIGDLKEIDEKLQYDYTPYGGESVVQVRARVETILDEAKNTDYKNILFVTSRGPIRQLHHILENRIEPNVPNASLHTFEI